jgi:integrase
MRPLRRGLLEGASPQTQLRFIGRLSVPPERVRTYPARSSQGAAVDLEPPDHAQASLRSVPLPAPALAALDPLPPRIDTKLVFPGRRGGYLNLNSWRRREWDPAVKAAGLAHRPPCALRHTFAAWSITAGIGLFELARFMGTSVEQIDRTYGHLCPTRSTAPGRRSRRLGTLRPPRKRCLRKPLKRKPP